MIYGGDEEPCVSERELDNIESQLGRPCPRVDLLPWNRSAARVAGLALPMIVSGGGQVEYQQMLIGAILEQSAERSLSILERVHRAIHKQDEDGESVASMWVDEYERKRAAANKVKK